MLWLFSRGKIGIVSMVVSLVITALVLSWLWSAIAPASLLYQIIFAVVLFVFGVVLFFTLVFLFTAVTMLFFFLLLRRRINKSMRKMFKRLEK